jgi:SAM-dependent methyltransferase
MSQITSQDLREVYSSRFRGRQTGRDRIWSVLTGRFFQQWIAADAVVLDLGAGYGEFLRHIRAGRKLGVDANPQAAEFWGEGIEPFQFDVTEPWPLPRRSVDCVFTSNFFEHLGDKKALERCVEQIYGVLKPGGVLVAMGPNIRRIRGAYWDFYDHFVPLTERSLSELLALKGFRIDLCRASFLPYSMSFTPASIVSWVYPPLLRLYLGCRWLWPLFGKQFLIVASRAGAAPSTRRINHDRGPQRQLNPLIRD